MHLHLSCRCGHRFKITRPHSGERVRCPECDRRFAVPGKDDEETTTGNAGRRAWLLVVGAVVGVLAVGVVLAFLFRGGKPAPPADEPAPADKTPATLPIAAPAEGPRSPAVAPVPDPSADEREATELRLIPGEFKHLAVTPDGKEFLLATYQTITRIDSRTGLTTGEFENPTGFSGLRLLAVTPNGKTLILASEEKVYVRDYPSGAARNAFKFPGRQLDRAAVSPDGKTLHVFGGTSAKKPWEVWDLASGTAVGNGPLKEKEQLTLLSATPEGRHGLGRLSTSGSERPLVVLDLAASKVVRPLEDFTRMGEAVLSPDGKQVVGHWRSGLRAIDAATGLQAWDVGVPGYSATVAPRFSTDGNRVVGVWRHFPHRAGDSVPEYIVPVWEGGREVCRIPVPGKLSLPNTDMALSYDGRTAISIGNAARVWRLPAKSVPVLPPNPGPVAPGSAWPAVGETTAFETRDPGDLWALSLTARVALRTHSARLTLHELPSGRELANWIPDTKFASGSLPDYTSVDFSQDGKRAITADANDTIRIWDVATGRELRAWAGGRKAIFAPNGKNVIAGNLKVVRVWDVEKGTPSAEWPGFVPLACSRDGNIVVYRPDGDAAAPLRVHHVAENKDRELLAPPDTSRAIPPASDRRNPLKTGGNVTVERTVISPDGRTIAAGVKTILTSRQTTRVWDAVSGAFLGELGKEGVWPIGFSPDGLAIFTAGSDKAIREWDLSTGTDTKRAELPWPYDRGGDLSPNGNSAVAFGLTDSVVSKRAGAKSLMIGVVGLRPYSPPATAVPTQPELKIVAATGGQRGAEFTATGLPPTRLGEKTAVVALLTPKGGVAPGPELLTEPGLITDMQGFHVLDALSGGTIGYSEVTRDKKFVGYRFVVFDLKETDPRKAHTWFPLVANSQTPIAWKALGETPRLSAVVVRYTMGAKNEMIPTGVATAVATAEIP